MYSFPLRNDHKYQVGCNANTLMQLRFKERNTQIIFLNQFSVNYQENLRKKYKKVDVSFIQQSLIVQVLKWNFDTNKLYKIVFNIFKNI